MRTDASGTVRLLMHYPSFDMNGPQNERGETALMLAMSRRGGNADLVKELMQLPGIDLTKTNNVS